MFLIKSSFLVLLLAAILGCGSSGDDKGGDNSPTPANTPPTADAGNDQTVTEGEDVRLSASASRDSDGKIVGYLWKKGVQTLSSNPDFTISNLPVGAHILTLTVTDNDGDTDSDTVLVTVMAANNPPIANAGSDQTVTEGDTVNLSASGSSDSDGTIVSYLWKEGSTELSISADFSISTLSVGEHVFFLFVTDDDGATSGDSVTITVNAVNNPPIANAGSDQTVNEGDLVNLSASGSSDSDGTIVSYLWKEGSTELSTSSDFSIDSLSVGEHVLFLFVTDDDGATSGDSVTITVNEVVSLTSLNDTGIVNCGDYAFTDSGTSYDVIGSGNHNNDVDCASTNTTQVIDGNETDNGLDIVRAGQDALYGRDYTHNDNSDGHAGFSFTKLDSNGNPLDVSEASWSCVEDNVTGLIWEVKTSSGLHSSTDTYNWYMTDSNSNGGATGYEDNNGAICTGYNSGDSTTFCNTEEFVNRVNTAGLCGANDWRLPSVEELNNIASRDRHSPSIDTNFFPRTEHSTSYYWTASAAAYDSDQAWSVGFGYGATGFVGLISKSTPLYIRLVRDKK